LSEKSRTSQRNWRAHAIMLRLGDVSGVAPRTVVPWGRTWGGRPRPLCSSSCRCRCCCYSRRRWSGYAWIARPPACPHQPTPKHTLTQRHAHSHRDTHSHLVVLLFSPCVREAVEGGLIDAPHRVVNKEGRQQHRKRKDLNVVRLALRIRAQALGGPPARQVEPCVSVCVCAPVG
jgi:hypothetical protein